MAAPIVIVVAGFAGNELSTPLFGLRGRVWLNYAALTAGAWRWLAIDSSTVLVPGPPLGAYYGVLTDQLGRAGYRVASPWIDWRQTISSSGQVLADLVRQLGREQPVYLLGHSRGGLVMRSALAQLGASQQLDLVGAAVGLGVPHQGSLSAAALLGGWQSTKQALYALLAVGQFLLAGGWPRVALNAVINAWPGTYELLPRPGSDWLPADQVAAVYDAATYSAHGLPISAGELAAARTSWAALPEAPPAVAWLDMLGLGVDTPLHVADASVIDTPSSMAWGLTGDGTVPAVAARQSAHPWISIATSHDQLPQDGRAIRAAVDWFADHA